MSRSLGRILVAASLSLFSTAGFAVAPTAAGEELKQERNFDARSTMRNAAAATQEPAQLAALEALSRSLPDLAVTIDSANAATRTLMNRAGFLTEADGSAAPETLARRWVDANAALLGLTADDLADAEVSDLVYHDLSGTTNLYLRQRVAGLPVYKALLQVNLASGGRIVSVNNLFLPRIGSALNTSSPSLTADQAIGAAAEHLGVAAGSLTAEANLVSERQRYLAPALSSEPIDAALMVLPIRRGEARLVWNFQVWTLDTLHAWDLTVDAVTGQVWTRIDWTDNEQYKVYPVPVESPNHTTPLPPADARVTEASPYLDAGLADPFGWHDTNNVAGAESTLTIGNNVLACIDSLAPTNSCDPGSSPDGTATLDFTFPLDLTLAPSGYRPAAVANLFYWNNLIHDVAWPYGFDEVGGNFQTNNYGRGGLGNDEVQGDAQDGAGTNNANFSTPPDGSKPRMQMFIWTAPTPDRDGDVDNGIIAHEYGHGISNRLVGGPGNVSCLDNLQQPGEGLSDWWSLFYTQPNDTSLAARLRGIGTYALNQPVTGQGIRQDYYDGDPAVNPEPQENTWTYESITGQTSEHVIGSRWAQAYWQVTWALIDAHGYNSDLYAYTNTAADAGNIRAMYYIIQGLKNTICDPAFTDVRDGVLAAAASVYGGEDVCIIWSAFAEFGLGANAVSSGSGGNTPANGFDVPLVCSFGSAGTDVRVCSTAGSHVQNVSVGPAYTSPPVDMSVSGNPAGSTAVFSVNPVPTVPANITLTVGNLGAVAAGTYNITVSGDDGVDTSNDIFALTVDVAAAPATTLVTPANNATSIGVQPTLTWTAVPTAVNYLVELSDDPTFATIDFSTTVTGTSTPVSTPLLPVTHYYWRVSAGNACGTTVSGVFNFITANIVTACGGPLTILDNLPATPYPSVATIAGVTGPILGLDIQITGLTHTFPDDLDLLLVAPSGQTLIFFSDAGGSGDVTGLNLTLSDSAATLLSDGGPLVAGSFRPSNVDSTGDGTYAAPAPAGPYTSAAPVGAGTFLSAFGAATANGAWNLFLRDDAGQDIGTLTQWCLSITSASDMPFLDGFGSGDTSAWSATVP